MVKKPVTSHSNLQRVLGRPDLEIEEGGDTYGLYVAPGDANGGATAWLVSRGRVSGVDGEFGALLTEPPRRWILGGVFRSPLPGDVRTVHVRYAGRRLTPTSSTRGWIIALPHEAGSELIRLSYADLSGSEFDGVEFRLSDIHGGSGPTPYGPLPG